MPDEIKPLTLGTLAQGAAEELWQDALGRILENIDNPNTDPKAKRSIVLTVTFVPDEERKAGDVAIACATKLAGVRSVTTGIYFGRHRGVFTVVEAPRQETLFTDPAARPRAIEPATAGDRREA